MDVSSSVTRQLGNPRVNVKNVAGETDQNFESVNDFFRGESANGQFLGDNDAESDTTREMAFALILADQTWGSSGAINYQVEALSMIDKIWQFQVVKPANANFVNPGDPTVGIQSEGYPGVTPITSSNGNAYIVDKYYLANGTWSDRYNLYQPLAYTSPGHLRVFAEFERNSGCTDADRWLLVVDDYYDILDRVHESVSRDLSNAEIIVDGTQYPNGGHPSDGYPLLYPAWALPTGQSLDQYSLSFSGPGNFQYVNAVNDFARLPQHLMTDLMWYPEESRAAVHLDRLNTHFSRRTSFDAFPQWFELDGSGTQVSDSGTAINDSSPRDSNLRDAAVVSLMRNTDISSIISEENVANIDSSDTKENALRAAAWQQVFSDYEVLDVPFFNETKQINALVVSGRYSNPVA